MTGELQCEMTGMAAEQNEIGTWEVPSLLCSVLQALAGRLLAASPALLGQENALDVGQDSTLSNGDPSKELVELLIIPDGQLEVPGVDSLLLVVSRGVPSEFQDLGSKILHDGGQVDGCACSNTLREVASAEKTVYTPNRELEASSG